MTVVAVARKNGKITMASDSQTTHRGHLAVQGIHSKVKRRGDVLIGSAGSCGLHEVLSSEIFELIEKDKNWYDSWGKYCLGADEKSAIYRIDKTSAYVLIVHDGNIIYASPGGHIVNVKDDFFTLGSGDEVALGAMIALWDYYKDPEIIVKKAVEAACSVCTGCGLPVVCETVRIK